MKGFFTASLVLFVACVGDSPIIGPTDAGVSPDNTTPPVDGSSGDTSTGSDAGDASTPWTPAAWGNALTLWLVGDLGVGLGDAGEVVSWTDQSPNPVTFTGNNVLQDTTNGHGVINFPGAHISMSTPNATKLELGATDDVMFAFVAQTIAGSSGLPGGYAWMKGHESVYAITEGTLLGIDIGSDTSSAGELSMLFGDGGSVSRASSKKPFADGNYHLVVARRTAGGMELRIRSEGLEETSTLPAPYDISDPSYGVAIGSVVPPGDTFPSSFALKFAEIVVVRRSSAFTVAEVSQLEAYEKAKYALP